jgi:hypothetical protein
MFKHLFSFREESGEEKKKPLEGFGEKDFNSTYHFFKNLDKFAFFQDLSESMEATGKSISRAIEDRDYDLILDHLLSLPGLNYGNLPKGMIKFHQYPGFSRTALGEHLVEGANYCKDAGGVVRIHFTVSPEHMEGFKALVDEVVPYYSEKFNVTYDISFSIQKPSTDTLAVDMSNEPFREEDGSLLFRPGGHGALIENLNDIDSDIIFIKNIDNVVPDHLKEETYRYKKVLGGLLLDVIEKINEYLAELENPNINNGRVYEIEKYCSSELSLQFPADFNNYSHDDKRETLQYMLNRPVRICGMVKNEGEPGGGPFWVRNSKGEVSLQIVESSQINKDDEQQAEILAGATHFNPVDLVCSVRDYKGQKFDLRKFVDPETGFISIKSKNGKQLKAQELPGLWNGAMANWITLFVETPIITFNPVKTVNDLLRPQHQPG